MSKEKKRIEIISKNYWCGKDYLIKINKITEERIISNGSV